MEFTIAAAVSTLFALINKMIGNVPDHNARHSNFPLQQEYFNAYAKKHPLVAIVWAFTQDSEIDRRAKMAIFLRDHSGINMSPLHEPGASLVDYNVQVSTGDWAAWQTSVLIVEIDSHQVIASDVHKPLMLCGLPGSGNTMTLSSVMCKLSNMDVVRLNFSSATTPELVLKKFDQHCGYKRTLTGIFLAPIQIGKWIVIFCNEINLPAADKYGTQKVISFLRQLVKGGGFWRPSDKVWIKLERIQFVGACNPPTDPGWVTLSPRFILHAPLVMVDYSGEASLKQIYRTFNRAVLKVLPSWCGHAEPLTLAMPLETLSLEGLVPVWAHEALRLFSDHLVSEEEKQWTEEMIDSTASNYFHNINQQEALTRPILFSNWTSKYYISVDREELQEYSKARLWVFYEEELDVPLVLFNDVLDHVLRINRVFQQVQGHLLLIGVSGSGKGRAEFLRQSGCKAEKICFIMDESNVLDSGFLERMNTLLANAEVPGLFEGNELASLITACKEGAQQDGVILD
ncbi:hypothetical protein PPACK8108_LOCUS18778 [Phakopsora pachyrhizi]|uniref:Dynein heavy chain, cytoplasmic n=1 Tax=Phakopsora pachyrhizi TaxID=170000 RepID=A0AAV0BB54_PHAPC|nr:hypothetical protein PPACK8108_LOCUS18778 [Phakopsora pachyrhizi]